MPSFTTPAQPAGTSQIRCSLSIGNFQSSASHIYSKMTKSHLPTATSVTTAASIEDNHHWHSSAHLVIWVWFWCVQSGGWFTLKNSSVLSVKLHLESLPWLRNKSWSSWSYWHKTNRKQRKHQPQLWCYNIGQCVEPYNLGQFGLLLQLRRRTLRILHTLRTPQISLR